MEKEARVRAEKRRQESEAARQAAIQRAALADAAAEFDAKERLMARMQVHEPGPTHGRQTRQTRLLEEEQKRRAKGAGKMTFCFSAPARGI